MKSIPLYNAYSLLSECKAVIIDGKFVEIYSLCYAEEGDNEFLILQWEEEVDGEVLDVEVVFNERDNFMVEVDGQKLIMTNTNGDTEEMILLRAINLEYEENQREHA